MCLKQPVVLVEFTRQLGKEVNGDGVAQVIRFFDGCAQRIHMLGDAVQEELQH